MTWQIVIYLVLGSAAGGFINGLAGTGTALFALGFYLIVLDPVTAVAIVALMSVLTGIQGLWVVRSEIFANKVRLARFLVPGLLGVPLGVSLLEKVDAEHLRIAIAIFLIVYGSYFSFRKSLPALTRPLPVWDLIIGAVSGVLGGAASVSGAIPAMWLSLRSWPKVEIRAVLQPFNVAVLSATVATLFMKGAFNESTTQAMMITIPTGLVTAQVGIFVFRYLSDTMFRRVLIVLTLFMGVGILIPLL